MEIEEKPDRLRIVGRGWELLFERTVDRWAHRLSSATGGELRSVEGTTEDLAPPPARPSRNCSASEFRPPSARCSCLGGRGRGCTRRRSGSMPSGAKSRSTSLCGASRPTNRWDGGARIRRGTVPPAGIRGRPFRRALRWWRAWPNRSPAIRGRGGWWRRERCLVRRQFPARQCPRLAGWRGGRLARRAPLNTAGSTAGGWGGSRNMLEKLELRWGFHQNQAARQGGPRVSKELR